MSLVSRLLKANPSAQVSDTLTGYFAIPSAKQAFIPSVRALFMGGSSASNVIDYITVETTGNAIDFGDLIHNHEHGAAFASTTTAVVGGGSTNGIEYLTILTLGNGTDFGDLAAANSTPAGHSSDTRGLFAGGEESAPTNRIQYVTIASAGNTTNFGNLTEARLWISGCGSSTRATFAGGQPSGGYTQVRNTIDYVTIASTGNATDFGDLTVARQTCGGTSNATRGLWGGGILASSPGAYSNVIDYITIASTGNATDFGDFSASVKAYMTAASSSTRGVFASGHNASGADNEISYVTIATTGNTTDFGDRTVSRYGPSGTSNGHGGLQ